MKSKNVLVALIVVLVGLVICGGALAYVYLATDVLKTNSQLFVKYGQEMIADMAKLFDDETVNAYYAKKLSNNYENIGNFRINAQGTTGAQKINIDDRMLTFKGAIDIANKEAEQTIDLNYSSKEKFSFSYVRNNDLYALASDEVVNKYIAVENNNLKDFATKLGVTDTTNIPDKIILEDYKSKLSKEEIEVLKTKYSSLITNQLVEEDFSKQEGKENAYVLTLQGEKLKTIITNIMQELRNEPFVLDTLKSQEQINKYKENIDTAIEELPNEDFSNSSIQVIVEKGVGIQLLITYPDGNVIVDISKLDNGNIKVYAKEESTNNEEDNYFGYNSSETTPNEITLELSRTVATDNCTYSVNGLIEDKEVKINIDLAGISTNNVTETFTVEYKGVEATENNEINTKIEYTNAITFKDNVNITELNDENSVVLNTYNKDALNSLMSQLGEQLVKVNTEKIERVMQGIKNGEEDADVGMGIIAYSTYMIQKSAQEAINNTPNLEAQAAAAHNAQFLQYEGDVVSGTSVRALINMVKNSNLIEEEYICYLNGYSTSQELSSLLMEIQTGKTYSVSVKDYYDNGMIKEMTIME